MTHVKNKVKTRLSPGLNPALIMARPSNTVETLSMTITVTPQMKQYLEDLVVKGLYGSSPAEIVRNMVQKCVRQHITDKDIKEREWRLNGEGKLELVRD